jgi:hypothetical protein
MSNDEIILDSEAVTALREALIIGLRSYGEVQRIKCFAKAFDEAGGKLPSEAYPVFVEESNAPCLFADAFAYLNI